VETTVKSSRSNTPADYTTAKPQSQAAFSSPFWKKVQKNLTEVSQESAPPAKVTNAVEARQLEQDLFWKKVEKKMDPKTSESLEEQPGPASDFKPLSFWEKVQKNLEDAPAAAKSVVSEPEKKPATSSTPGSFWSKVSKNMEAPKEEPTLSPPAAPSSTPGSFWSKVAKNMDGEAKGPEANDVTPAAKAKPFKPLSFWEKVSKNLDGSDVPPDSGIGDMPSVEAQTPVQTNYTPVSFWDKVQKNIGGPSNVEKEDIRGRSTSQSSAGSRRKFTPQFVSTSKRSFRKSWMDEDDDDIPLLPHERVVQAASFSSSPGSSPARRRFAPQLIETAKRTHKGGERSAVPPRETSSAASGDGSYRTYLSSADAPSAIPSHIAELLNKSNQGPARKRYPSRRNTRGHSFKIPELESIDSSESEEETGPPSLSLSVSHSQSDLSEFSEHNFKHATRIRESIDDRFSGYLLELAAQAAERQLREQAEAAFPNSESHEPVAHYMDIDSGESEDEDHPEIPVKKQAQSVVQTHKREVLTRNHRERNDSDDERIALQELQNHAERVSQAKQRGDSEDTWTAQDAAKQVEAALALSRQRDAEGWQMLKAASPPMLGDDISFPRCASPDNARFDVTQGSDFLRNSMCALTQQAHDNNDNTGLWDASKLQEHKSPTKPSQPVLGRPSRDSTGNMSINGLWNGLCTNSDLKLSPMPTGLITPMYTPAKEKDDPFASFSVINTTSSTAIAGVAGRMRNSAKRVPPSPKPSMHLALANEKLELESKVTSEFTDDFVTQVYNYLSIGYPAIARKYDDELARISRVDVAELRQDDRLADAKGYIRLGEDEFAARDTVVDEHQCARWRALRLYVREWGRQQASFAGPEPLDPHRAWGLTARRGSWGL